ncbi:MAG: hypothetical protein EBQ66_02135 [Flavobacteriia bacterium]|nr:hypothetical protein [Flavobacteriia bacterium]
MRVRVFVAITTFLAISLACNDSPKKVRSEKTLAPTAPLQITFLSYSDSLFLLKKEDGFTGFGYRILSEFAATYKLKLNVRMCATEAEVYERMRKGEGDLCITRRMVYETANSNFHHSTAIVSRIDTTFFKSNFRSSDLIYSNSSFYRNQNWFKHRRFLTPFIPQEKTGYEDQCLLFHCQKGNNAKAYAGFFSQCLP